MQEKILKYFQLLIIYPISLLVFSLIFKIKVHGQENLKDLNPRSIIFASNHSHWFDPLIGGLAVLLSLTMKEKIEFLPIRFIAAKEFFNFIKQPFIFPFSLIVAFFVRINGCIPVLRGDRTKTLEEKLAKAVEALKNGARLWIFPEGKMSKTGELQKGKKGIGYLHKTTKAPIIPVALINVYKCTKFKNLLLFLTGKKRIKIYIGKPIVDISNLEIEEISSIVMEKIRDLIEQDKKNY